MHAGRDGDLHGVPGVLRHLPLPPVCLGPGAGARGVDLAEDVGAVEREVPVRRVVVQDRIPERRRLAVVDHRVERPGQRAGTGAVVAAAEAETKA